MPCAFVALLVFIFALWPEPKVDPGPPLPSPNGYDDFVKAGNMLAVSSNNYTKMSVEELRSYVGTNQDSLRLVRLGLTRECRVPVENSMVSLQRHMEDASQIKHVARLLSAEGRLAEIEDHYELAARSHSQRVRLGQLSSMEGLIIDKLIGVAIEDVALADLERISQRLNKLSTRETIHILEEIEAGAESSDEYFKRDRKWEKTTFGLRVWTHWIQAAWAYKSLKPYQRNHQNVTVKFLRTDRRRRQLILTLAARAYELEHGKRPVRAEDLVPSILSAIPKDPETGTDLVLIPAQ